MATKGTRNTAIAFGSFEIQVALKKAEISRDLATEIVDADGQKIGGGGGLGGGRRKPDVDAGEARAVRVSDAHVVRLPQDELDAIERASKERWALMQVLEVIDYREVPTERIKGSYWLQPARGSVKALALLTDALRETGATVVVKWIATSREKLGVIRVRNVGRGDVALLLSEVAFANDFQGPDADALAINDVIDTLDPAACQAARNLLDEFARGDVPEVDRASDEAVDARIALFERVQAEQLEAELGQVEAAAEAQSGHEAAPEDAGADVVSIDSARAAERTAA